MNVQITTIEVDQSTAAIIQTLKAEAEAQGKTLATLLLPLLPTNGAHPLQEAHEVTGPVERQEERPFYETATPEEWIRELNAWAASHDPNTPVILDDSREAIYGDDGR